MNCWLGRAWYLAGSLTLSVWLGGADCMAGKLEDLLLENKQITVDQWVQLKADEERRQAKSFEQTAVGDVPVRARWYEKISIRGYTQLRYNHTLNNDLLINQQGDRSIGGNPEFFLRRGRVIISGQPHERVFVYIQPDFASSVNGSTNVGQLRDWYADLFLTENKEWRIRAGQSKVPYGFENMQSSQNRLALDRNDALNSAVFNERDMGLFLYYAPTAVRERFRRLANSGLKGSGDYGMLGLGVYNGQNANQREANKNKHVVFHSTYPFEFSNGQILEVGLDAYTGQYHVSTAPVVPTSPAAVSQGVPLSPIITNGGNYLDERVAAHFVLYPQPFGLQGEYTFGRGPELNRERTEVVTGNLRGGYLQLFYNYRCDTFCQNVFPFIRYQEYYGGKKHEFNAPRHTVREVEMGLEYQFNQALELTVMYTFTGRTSSDLTTVPASCADPGFSGIPCMQTPYQYQSGNLVRFQLQWNF